MGSKLKEAHGCSMGLGAVGQVYLPDGAFSYGLGEDGLAKAPISPSCSPFRGFG